MIRPEKLPNALFALHFILVWLRSIATQTPGDPSIAKVLDYAERMPWHVASPEDMTEEFRSYLAELAETYPWAKGVLEKYDQPTITERW